MQNFHQFVSGFSIDKLFSIHFIFSGTASYRLMPEIILKKPVYDKDAEQLQKCFTQGVIELEDDDNGNEIFSSSSPIRLQ
jgi:DNA-directed RNA polymerase I and III subunit RPAC1